MVYKVVRYLFINIFNADIRTINISYQLVLCFQCCSVCMYVYVSVCMQIHTYTYMHVRVCMCNITHHNIILKIILKMFYFILFKYNTPQTRKVWSGIQQNFKKLQNLEINIFDAPDTRSCISQFVPDIKEIVTNLY